MSVLEQAIKAAEKRKESAGITAPEPGAQSLVMSTGADVDRAIFSGFDIDYEELTNWIMNQTAFFFTQSGSRGLVHTFSGCWADGFLTGLMAANVAPHHESPGSGDRSTEPGDTVEGDKE